MAYKIQVTVSTGKQAHKAYVAIERNAVPATWDGSWYTRENEEPEKIKTWKTRRGAENWLAQRSIIQNTMSPVIEEIAG